MKCILTLLFCVCLFSSCLPQQRKDQVVVSYHLETKIVLDIGEEHLDELLQAIKATSNRVTVNGHVANVRPSNEKNLNGYSIFMRKRNGQCAFHSLHNNFPFGISRGNKLIYNFKHLLTEKDVKILQILIPEWQD